MAAALPVETKYDAVIRELEHCAAVNDDQSSRLVNARWLCRAVDFWWDRMHQEQPAAPRRVDAAGGGG